MLEKIITLTILCVVFNPAGELEILNLLKGEVISLSSQELKILAIVYGLVYSGLVLFRREFLLNSFDRDLSFLLTGGSVQWSFWLYVLCGFSIAIVPFRRAFFIFIHSDYVDIPFSRALFSKIVR